MFVHLSEIYKKKLKICKGNGKFNAFGQRRKIRVTISNRADETRQEWSYPAFARKWDRIVT